MSELKWNPQPRLERHDRQTRMAKIVLSASSFALVTGGIALGGIKWAQHIDSREVQEFETYNKMMSKRVAAKVAVANKNMTQIRREVGEDCRMRLDILTGSGSLADRDESTKLRLLTSYPKAPCGTIELDVLDSLNRYAAAQDAMIAAKEYHWQEDPQAVKLEKHARTHLELSLAALGIFGGVVSGGIAAVYMSDAVDSYRDQTRRRIEHGF